MSDVRICRGPLHKEPEELPTDAFGIDARAKDGRQRFCKNCIAAKARDRRDKKKTPKLIKEIATLNTLIAKLPENDSSLSKTFHAMGHGKTLEGANTNVNKFLTKVSDEALETVLAQFRNPDKATALVQAFEGYIQSVLVSGTHTEQRDMFREAFRIFGWGSDKHEIRAGGISQEDREAKLRQIHEVIEGKTVNGTCTEEE